MGVKCVLWALSVRLGCGSILPVKRGLITYWFHQTGYTTRSQKKRIEKAGPARRLPIMTPKGWAIVEAHLEICRLWDCRERERESTGKYKNSPPPPLNIFLERQMRSYIFVVVQLLSGQPEQTIWFNELIHKTIVRGKNRFVLPIKRIIFML